MRILSKQEQINRRIIKLDGEIKLYQSKQSDAATRYNRKLTTGVFPIGKTLYSLGRIENEYSTLLKTLKEYREHLINLL